MKKIGLIALVAFLAGCAQIATVKQTNPHFAPGGAQEPQLAFAERKLVAARKVEQHDPSQALGDYLAAGEAAAEQLHAHPSDKQARDLYDFAVGRSIEVIEEGRLDPWHRTAYRFVPERNVPLYLQFHTPVPTAILPPIRSSRRIA